jgi:thiopurine S-methyltransferase
MEPDFWHERWHNNQIGFHESDVNPGLVHYLPSLSLTKDSRVFVPLCGKTVDIGWLASEGFRVAGAELSELAVQQLFAELGIEPGVDKQGSLLHYHTPGIDIYAGDIFDLTPEVLGSVDAIYDRAALVALPEAMRRQYTAHLMALTNRASQLIITFDYDQQLMNGPPFCVTNDEVLQHYADHYQTQLLSSKPLEGKLRGEVEATRNVWMLQT